MFLIFFCPQNVEKTTLKSSILSMILVVSEIFHDTAQQPKWQNSCFKMWPIEQLYVELGMNYKN